MKDGCQEKRPKDNFETRHEWSKIKWPLIICITKLISDVASVRAGAQMKDFVRIQIGD